MCTTLPWCEGNNKFVAWSPVKLKVRHLHDCHYYLMSNHKLPYLFTLPLYTLISMFCDPESETIMINIKFQGEEAYLR